MKFIFRMFILTIAVLGLVCPAVAEKKVTASSIQNSMIEDVHSMPKDPAGTKVARMAHIVVKGIADINASDSSDADKNEAVALALAHIIVAADELANQLMMYVVVQLDSVRWVQISTAVVALSDRTDKATILSGIMTQLGPDTELGKLAKNAANNPVAVTGQRVSVLVGRVVAPAKSLSSSRQAGGARTLPLPPIRRVEGNPRFAPAPPSPKPPPPPPERPPVDPYSGQKK